MKTKSVRHRSDYEVIAPDAARVTFAMFSSMAASLSGRPSHRRVLSYDKENTGDDDFDCIEGDFALEQGASLGISFSSEGRITRIETSSPVARKFKVGDTIIQVNGRDASTMSISTMLAESEQVSITALRPRAGQGDVPTDPA